MNSWEIVRTIAILGPILGMIVVGFWIVLKSGESRNLGVSNFRRAGSNLLQAAVVVSGWILGLAMVQHLVGFKMSMGW